MKCPKCKTVNSDNAEYCISCQFDFSDGIRASPNRYPIYKRCPICKKKYPPDANYCTKCQHELVEIKKSKVPVVVLCSALGVIIVSSVIFGVIYASPGYMLTRAIKNGNTEKVASIIMSHPEVLHKLKYKEKYIEFIDVRANKYIDEVVDYDIVSSDFENFQKANSYTTDDDIKETTSDNLYLIDLVHTSRVAFDEAENAYAIKNYQLAELKYTEIVPEDKNNYSSSEKKLKEIEDLKESYISQSNERRESNDFDGSIEVLTEGIAYFSYDEKYNVLYYNGIVDSVSKESDFLMEEEKYFSSNGETGAFNLVYSYLNNENYSDNEILKSKLNEIAEESEISQINLAAESLGLTNQNNVFNRCSDIAAKDYYNDDTIQDDNSYILTLCQNDDGVQSLLSDIPDEKQVNVVLISNIAMTAEDFSTVSKTKLDAYSDYTWDYTGIILC